MPKTSFYSEEELRQLGLHKYGENVKISRKASLYGVEKMSIGSNVRVDDFCILSGRISIGNNVHVAAYSALYGADAGISIADFANISSRVCVYAVSDDYSGLSMTNPTIPDEYKHVIEEKVCIGKHVIIGSGCTLLPGVNLAEGCALGAMSLCKKSTEPWYIYVGIPAKKLKIRSKTILTLEKDYIDQKHLL